MGGAISISDFLHPKRAMQRAQAEKDAQTQIMQAQAAQAIQQGRMMTARDKAALLESGPQVQDSTIGPSVQQTSQTTPDLPMSAPASMQAERDDTLPDGTPIHSPGPSGLAGQMLGTGAMTTAPRPADAARVFSYQDPNGGAPLSVELSADYPLLHHAMLGAELRRAVAQPFQIPGTNQTVSLTPEEIAKNAVPQTIRYEQGLGQAGIRADAARYGSDNRLQGTEDTIEGRAAQGDAQREFLGQQNGLNRASKEKIAAGRDETTRFVTESRNRNGLSKLQLAAALRTASGGKDTGSALKASETLTKLQAHRSQLQAALDSGVILNASGTRAPIDDAGRKYIQSELKGTDQSIEQFQQAITKVSKPAPGGAAAPASAAAPPQEGQTATNPQTRKKVVFRGGQWVPAA